ncbi:MAG: glycerol-3-phosphate 1-O-acyltransferase PlsY [Kiloniellales bacterium]
MPDPLSWDLAGPYLLVTALGAYLLGSIPFGVILTRLAGLGDLRGIGSGNIGATNVLRTGRKDLAALTLLLDGAKGWVPTFLAGHFWGPDAALVAALAALLGHILPLWLRFRGGKGVATALGAFLALAWQVGLLAMLVWVIAAVLSRYSSVASLLSVASAPLCFWFVVFDLQRLELTAVMALIIWIRHSENIGRLLKGTESKIEIGGKAR